MFEWVRKRLSVHEITYVSEESNLGATFHLILKIQKDSKTQKHGLGIFCHP